MKDFAANFAVITGGGTGVGRELARQLVAEGRDMAICDVIEENMAKTLRLCESEAPPGIGASVSFVGGDRDEWERTFNIYWYGVYYNARAFMPYLVAADKAHMVNTSSVKGFTEALVTDFRINAPHVKVSVVMLGHIGTSIIAINSGKISGHADPIDMSGEEIEQIRKRVEKRMEIDLSATTNDQIWEVMKAQGEPSLD